MEAVTGRGADDAGSGEAAGDGWEAAGSWGVAVTVTVAVGCGPGFASICGDFGPGAATRTANQVEATTTVTALPALSQRDEVGRYVDAVTWGTGTNQAGVYCVKVSDSNIDLASAAIVATINNSRGEITAIGGPHGYCGNAIDTITSDGRRSDPL
ncbi:hypothetical protein [Streptomyces sp. NPDC023588]|uniref:hypothetical protein n=1 Tax=Streptomyces sp. NPDC023588 TaxID=3154907 RepID=UPI0033FA04D9